MESSSPASDSAPAEPGSAEPEASVPTADEGLLFAGTESCGPASSLPVSASIGSRSSLLLQLCVPTSAKVQKRRIGTWLVERIILGLSVAVEASVKAGRTRDESAAERRRRPAWTYARRFADASTTPSAARSRTPTRAPHRHRPFALTRPALEAQGRTRGMREQRHPFGVCRSCKALDVPRPRRPILRERCARRCSSERVIVDRPSPCVDMVTHVNALAPTTPSATSRPVQRKPQPEAATVQRLRFRARAKLPRPPVSGSEGAALRRASAVPCRR